jgi:tetratricopeptide (TPR) repeat protein
MNQTSKQSRRAACRGGWLGLTPTIWGALALVAGGILSGGCQNAAQGSGADQPLGVDHYVAGAIALRDGDRPAAKSHLSTAVAINPDLRMAHEMLGDIYRQDGQLGLAQPQYEAASRLDPYNANNWYYLGLVDQLLNRVTDAIAAYVQSLQLEPKNAPCNMNLGVAYLTLGQTDDAVKYLSIATQEDPQTSDGWSNLGVALDAKGQTSQAEEAYRRALELAPGSVPVLQNLGSNLLSQGKSSEAIAVFSQLVQKDDAPIVHKRYGDALAQAHRDDEAIAQYDRALAQAPNYYQAMSGKAFALIDAYHAGLELDESKRHEAIELWRKSLGLHPNQPTAEAAIKQWETSTIGSASNP